MRALGFDTSNYTTSVAVFDGEMGQNVSRLLEVKPNQLGLRQSDALFAHVSRLPDVLRELFQASPERDIFAVGASTRPRNVDGSYMPCFLAGASQAQNIAKTLDVPFYAFSHQQGHIAAALWSAKRMDLLSKPHLAWHLSGGTTELLLVEPEGKSVKAVKLGGSTDLAAGQIVDRTGKLLNLPFPSGKALDALLKEESSHDFFKIKTDGLFFSLSGLENKVQRYRADGASASATARYAMLSLCSVLLRVCKEARKEYSDLEIVFSGGVASNSMLREKLAELKPVFSPPQFSTDNAMGIAVLTYLQEK